MNVFKYIFLPNSERFGYFTIVVLALTLVVLLFLQSFFLYKKERLSVNITTKMFEFIIMIIMAIIIFNTLYIHFALPLWTILYLSMGLFDKKRRIVRYVNKKGKMSNKSKKLYQYIHKTSADKTFLITIKEYLYLSEIQNFDKNCFNKKDKAWKRSFFPFNYFVVGLIIPSINLLLIGSQYFKFGILPLILLECNILIFTILYFIYQITYYLAVEIETSRMFQSKVWFNINYALFSFGVVIALNGIIMWNI